MPGAYYLFCLLDGEHSVGIWYLFPSQTGQPVRLDADLVEWVASRPIVGGGPARLSAGPYRYTQELNGEVFATNDPSSSQDWFLIPSNNDGTYLIAADPRGNRVWTAQAPREPIRIADFTGEPNQLFRFVARN